MRSQYSLIQQDAPRVNEPATVTGCGCMIASFLLVVISVITFYVALVKIINALP